MIHTIKKILEFDISGGRIGIRPIPCSQVIFDDRQIGDYSDDCEVGCVS